MTIPIFDEATIRAGSSVESYNRGKEYYAEGAVLSIVQRGETLHMEVQGSGYQPYTVTVELDGDEIVGADCSCPYDWGGWCKHIVAALLACRGEPETVEERPSLSALLADLNADQLRRLIEKLADVWPEAVSRVERWVATGMVPQLAGPTAPPAATAAPSTLLTFDLTTIRRQVRAAVRRGGEGMDDYLTQVRQIMENRQFRDALTLLEAISEVAVASLDPEEPPYSGGNYRGDYYYDDDDAGSEFYTLFEGMADLWAEILLSADLSPKDREEYQGKLMGWDEELAGIEWLGEEEFLTLPLLALEYYWDYPPLQRVLAGEITDLGAWEEEGPNLADELAGVRLRILERQGRLQEYLHLAQAEGQTTQYINMLAKMGRSDEAVTEAIQYLQDAASAHMVAQTLHNAGQSQAAFRVAEHGLSGEGHAKYELAIWLKEKANAAGDKPLALRAGSAAVLERRELKDYLDLQKLAKESWPSLRDDLLAKLHQQSGGYGANAVAIFLHEKLIDDAIAALGAYAHARDTMAVMEAARQSRPDWVIQTAEKQANSIINAGKADHYIDAVAWLKHAKAAYTAHGRQNEWNHYLAQVREKHGRKYKLMGLLKELN
jgi:uncharacterized Zn finger protein